MTDGSVDTRTTELRCSTGLLQHFNIEFLSGNHEAGDQISLANGPMTKQASVWISPVALA